MEFDRPGENESDYRFIIPSANHLQSQVTVIIMSDCLKKQKSSGGLNLLTVARS